MFPTPVETRVYSCRLIQCPRILQDQFTAGLSGQRPEKIQIIFNIYSPDDWEWSFVLYSHAGGIHSSKLKIEPLGPPDFQDNILWLPIYWDNPESNIPTSLRPGNYWEVYGKSGDPEFPGFVCGADGNNVEDLLSIANSVTEMAHKLNYFKKRSQMDTSDKTSTMISKKKWYGEKDSTGQWWIYSVRPMNPGDKVRTTLVKKIDKEQETEPANIKKNETPRNSIEEVMKTIPPPPLPEQTMKTNIVPLEVKESTTEPSESETVKLSDSDHKEFHDSIASYNAEIKTEFLKMAVVNLQESFNDLLSQPTNSYCCNSSRCVFAFSAESDEEDDDSFVDEFDDEEEVTTVKRRIPKRHRNVKTSSAATESLAKEMLGIKFSKEEKEALLKQFPECTQLQSLGDFEVAIREEAKQSEIVRKDLINKLNAEHNFDMSSLKNCSETLEAQMKRVPALEEMIRAVETDCKEIDGELRKTMDSMTAKFFEHFATISEQKAEIEKLLKK